jgi:hypothetical protein
MGKIMSIEKKCTCGDKPSLQDGLGAGETLIGAGCYQCGVPEVMVAFDTEEVALAHFETENRAKPKKY